MGAEGARAANPAVEEFSGDAPARIAKRIFHATRPKFFPASVLPVLAGTAWGSALSGSFDALVFSLALFATMAVHAGANVLNDVGDEDNGTDRRNDERIYPYTGGSRFIQTGIMTTGAMRRTGMGMIVAAALAGLALIYLEGPLIIVFGLVGVLLAVLYSLGPVPLSTTGLGEIAVGLGLGVLPVVGAAWLQSGVIDGGALLFSVPVSIWVAAILLINEVPDIAADAASGKRTLPVRIGRDGTAAVYLSMHVVAVAVVAWLALAGPMPVVAIAVPLLLLVPALKASAGIRRGVDDRAGMQKSIEATLGIHTIGCLWLTAVMVYLAVVQGS